MTETKVSIGTYDYQPKLLKEFPAEEIQWKPETFNKEKTKALIVAYIDARAVMDRLDEVIGVGNWNDEYEVIYADKGNFSVKCKLTIFGVSKEDVGEGDTTKGAFSDALKRAAVKFGIGRHLYSLKQEWIDWEPSMAYKKISPDMAKKSSYPQSSGGQFSKPPARDDAAAQDDPVVPFGDWKGKRVSEITSADSVKSLIGTFSKSVADKTKEKFLQSNQNMLFALQKRFDELMGG